MNTLIDTPASATYHDGSISVILSSGREFSFPCSAYPRLAAGSPESLAKIEISPMGLHWPELDEDLSIRGLLRDHAKHEH